MIRPETENVKFSLNHKKQIVFREIMVTHISVKLAPYIFPEKNYQIKKAFKCIW